MTPHAVIRTRREDGQAGWRLMCWCGWEINIVQDDDDIAQAWMNRHYDAMAEKGEEAGPYDMPPIGLAPQPIPAIEEPPPADTITVTDGVTGYKYVYTTSRSQNDDRQTPGLGGKPFNKHSFGLEGHVSPYNNAEVNVGTDGIEVRLLQGINEADMSTVLAACEKATIGMEINEIDQLTGRPDEDSEMFAGGLQTALESQVVVFAVRGVDRTITHQIVRSRRAAFHQQSQRASFMGDCPEVRIPETVWTAGDQVRDAWLQSIAAAHVAYRAACEADVPYQDARYILPEGTDTFIICEYTLRELMAVYDYRACYMFQWGIRDVMHKMKAALVEKHPWMEPYLKISCERTSGAIDAAVDNESASGDHTCTFQGWESVEGHCPLAWARDTNRTFRSKKHEIKGQ